MAGPEPYDSGAHEGGTHEDGADEIYELGEIVLSRVPPRVTFLSRPRTRRALGAGIGVVCAAGLSVVLVAALPGTKPHLSTALPTNAAPSQPTTAPRVTTPSPSRSATASTTATPPTGTPPSGTGTATGIANSTATNGPSDTSPWRVPAGSSPGPGKGGGNGTGTGKDTGNGKGSGHGPAGSGGGGSRRSTAPAPPPTTTAPPPPPTWPEEEYNRHGANTFLDHHAVSGVGPPVPFEKTVRIACKVFDPSIPSVSPGGYWYLIAQSPWSSRYYVAANTFLNGDAPGSPYTHDHDAAVPDCPP